MFILYTEMCVVVGGYIKGSHEGLRKTQRETRSRIEHFLAPRTTYTIYVTVFIIIQTIAISAYTFKIPCRQKRNFPTDLTSGS